MNKTVFLFKPGTALQDADLAWRFDFEADGVRQLFAFIASGDGEFSPLSLFYGDGHSGVGLYAAYTEYPDEGATFIASAFGLSQTFVDRVTTDPTPEPPVIGAVPDEPTQDALDRALETFDDHYDGDNMRPALRATLAVHHAELVAEVERAREEVLVERRKRGGTEIVLGQWARAYHFVTDILPLDDRNLCRDPACPQNLAEQDRHRVDVLIQRAETAERELAQRDDALAALRETNRNLRVQIDRLMSEYCPEEMTANQRAEWERNQVAVEEEARPHD